MNLADLDWSRQAGFLSCLFGSEPRIDLAVDFFDFLSCLFGSERSSAHAIKPLAFLSCLFGSEHIQNPDNLVSDVSELPIRQ